MTQSNPSEMLERIESFAHYLEEGWVATAGPRCDRLDPADLRAMVATIERLNSELGRKDAKVEDTPALRASLKLLRARYDKARCDDEGVACCIRCNTMFLVNTLDRALNALQEQPK